MRLNVRSKTARKMVARTLSVMGVAVALAGCTEPDLVMDLQRCSEVRRLAILPFTDGPGNDGLNSGTAVAGFVLDLLVRSGQYQLVERSRLKAIMSEMDLQATDLIDPSTAARVGKVAGVDAVVTGSVSQYNSDKTVVYIYIVPVIGWKYQIGTTVRMVDVQNGAIIYSNSGAGQSGKNYTEAGKKAVETAFKPLFSRVKAKA